MKEWHKLVLMISVFLAVYFIPFGHPVVEVSIVEAFHMLQEYAREHVLLCLVPVFLSLGLLLILYPRVQF